MTSKNKVGGYQFTGYRSVGVHLTYSERLVEIGMHCARIMASKIQHITMQNENG